MHKLLALRGNPFRYGALAGFTALALTACGGGSGGDGAAIEAREQTITFQDTPVLYLNGTTTVSATASSGLPVTYSSRTNSICSVGPTSGLVTALRQGNCIILADQSGNATWAARNRSLTIPVEVSEADKKITFSPLADLVIYGQATVSASIGSNQPLEYASLTPDTCASTTKGVVEALAAGDCSILAKAVEAGGSGGKTAQTVAADTTSQADATDHSKEAVLTFPVKVPENTTAPGKPANVKASAGVQPNTVEIVIGELDSGGLPITYNVTSTLVGTVSATKEPGKPIVVDCQTSCRGHAFSVSPANTKGYGQLSDPVDVITRYDIVETFTEPATQPNDTIFTGTFDFNLTKGDVSNLAGNITQSMTTGTDDPDCATIVGCSGGYGKVPMTTEPLKYQLKSEKVTLDGVEGLLVTTFKLNVTSTYYKVDDDDWSPALSVMVGGVYYGYPGKDANPGNAYAMVFINLADPIAPLTQGQIDKLAYADCTPGGMMGAACMTGTSIAGYGAVGTMGGFPSSQIITRKP